jgi:hypothetical protein
MSGEMLDGGDGVVFLRYVFGWAEMYGRCGC